MAAPFVALAQSPSRNKRVFNASADTSRAYLTRVLTKKRMKMNEKDEEEEKNQKDNITEQR